MHANQIIFFTAPFIINEAAAGFAPVLVAAVRGDAEALGAPEASLVCESEPCPPQLRNLRVLLVDDEPDARDLLVAELSRCGAIVQAAASAPEALRLLGEWRPDVLISDVGMPEMDGYTLIRAVRQLPAAQGGRTPAIALTAYANNQDRARAFLSGFQAHLAKPIEPGELFAVLASVSGRTEFTPG